MKKNVILITPDRQDLPSLRGPFPHFTLSVGYAEAVVRAGGLPVIAPFTQDESLLDQWMEMADGVVISGGDFDIHPSFFGEEPHPALGTVVEERTRFEFRILERADHLKKPVLGICGGLQLINVFRRGSLWQDIPSQMDSPIEHRQAHPKSAPAHNVKINEKTMLYDVIGAGDLPVNSTHHQGVKKIGQNLVASATSEDGLIEGLEATDHPFMMGVQWHPEAMSDPRHQKIYDALIRSLTRQK